MLYYIIRITCDALVCSQHKLRAAWLQKQHIILRLIFILMVFIFCITVAYILHQCGLYSVSLWLIFCITVSYILHQCGLYPVSMWFIFCITGLYPVAYFYDVYMPIVNNRLLAAANGCCCLLLLFENISLIAWFSWECHLPQPLFLCKINPCSDFITSQAHAYHFCITTYPLTGQHGACAIDFS